MSLSRLPLRVAIRCFSTALALSSIAFAGRARAGGFEDTVGGSIALGRAANYGRVNDFLATWQNPANLAVIPGQDAGLELRLTVLDACFDRVRLEGVDYREAGHYPEGDFAGNETFQNVCNDAPLGVLGNVGWARSFPSGFGIGAGLFTPAGVGDLKYGNDTIVTWPPYYPDERYDITRTGNESPTRQMLVEQQSAAAWLGVGAGMRVLPQLRVGLGAAAGFAYARSVQVSSLLGGTFRDPEYLSEAKGTDWFVPRVIASVVGTPLPSLEVFGMLIYQDDIRASGDARFTSNGIQGAPLLNCHDTNPGPHCGVDGVKLLVPLPHWEGTLGARYAKRRAPERPVLDPMRDELWDLELEATFTGTSHVKDFRVDLYGENVTMDLPRLANNSTPMADASLLSRTTIVPKHWRDQWTVRIGGDYNVVPSRLALRAGLSLSTSAVPIQYMNIDSWPVAKAGLHLGATLGFGKAKLSVGYAHLFYRSMRVLPGSGEVRETVALNADQAQPVNEGDYSASQDVLSVQGNYTF